MIDLSKSFEVENGLTVNETVLPDSIFEKVRSLKQTYTGDLVSSVSFFNSLNQVDANRIAKIDLTYSNDFVTQQITTYYGPDGVTIHDTETITYNYSGDDSDTVEVS